MGFRVHAREGWAYAPRGYPPARAGGSRRAAEPRRRRPSALAGLLFVLVLALVVPIGLTAAAAATDGATFTVTSENDAVDANPGDTLCATVSGDCTLRAAVQETNALAGADTVLLQSGTYELAIPPLNQNLADVGDLDITDSLTISGAGASSTIIDGGTPAAGAPPRVHGLDRLFEVLAEGGEVVFSGLTFSDGYAAEYGGALFNNSSSTVRVRNATLTNNVADKAGGAIDNHLGGAVHVQNSVLLNNVSFESGSALNNQRGGLLTISGSTISSNSAADIGLDESVIGAGAIANNAELDAAGRIEVTLSTISENAAGGSRSGAAISNDGAGSVKVEGVTFLKNRSEFDGGAIFNGAGVVEVFDSTFLENAGESGGAIFNSTKDGRMTVTRSTFTQNEAAARGGAIANGGSGSLTVIDSDFTKNIAQGWGGAIVNDDKGSVAIQGSDFLENNGLNGGGFGNEGDGAVTVEGSTFTKNKAFVTSVLTSGEGGGMSSNSSGTVLVSDSSFTDNRARDGGGFTNEGGSQVTITGTQFFANRAEEKGGGILIQSGTVRMFDIEVVGNFADAAIEAGAGIAYEGDKLVSVGEAAAIESSVIRDNTAKGQGGGIDSRGDGPLDILTTTISGNKAAMGGGIHHVGDAPLEIRRSTLSGNSAEHGGGVFTDGDGETTVENTTVSANRAGQFGGGLLVSSRLVIRNSTVASNNAAFGGGINNGGGDFVGDGTVFLANTIVANSPTGGNCAGTMTSRGGNIDSGNSCQFRELSDQPGTDPLIGPLAANGGLTLTHALLADSPTLNRAACTDLDPCPPVDQRDVARPQGAGSDVGAFESELEGGGGGSTQPCTGRTERPVLADYDSWISESAPASIFGSDSILKVKSLSAANQRALVHFTLPPVPPSCVLVGATLRLQSSAATVGRTLEAVSIASDWTEASVSWSNQPGTAGPAASTPTGMGLREWDVLEQTRSMYELGGGDGFLIRDGVENETGEQSLHATEKGNDAPPQLNLIFDTPGTPPVGDVCGTTPQSLFADSDSWVNQGSPLNNFGTDSTLKVKSQVGYNARALIRFPLPALPARCTGIASATLRVEASSATDGRTIEAVRVASDWSESGVTWTNQPGTTGAAVSTPSFDGPLEWDVTAQIVDMYLSANNGFLIRDAAEDSVGEEQTFNGRLKLNDGPPELVLVLDDSRPETSIVVAPDPLVNEATAAFTFSSDFADAAFECALDSESFTSCPSAPTLSALSDGTHTLQVRATRPVRAVDLSPASHTWTVDTVAPEVKIDTGPTGPTNEVTPTFGFSGEAGATFQCKLEQLDFADCAGSYTPAAALGEGSYTFQVKATDAAGNESEPASQAFSIDTTSPAVTIDSGPSGLTKQTSGEFAFSSELGASFACKLDLGDYAGCDSPYPVGPLADGEHTFSVKATDEAGNTGAAATSTFTVDTQPPAVTIDSAPSGATNDTTPEFAFSSEPDATFECALGGAFAGCDSPYRVTTPLTDGAYSFQVKATDAAGNEGAVASTDFTVDTVGPEVTITVAPAALTNDSTPSFEFTSEDGASFECSLDGPFAGCGSSYQVLEALTDGEHTFQVRATDAAANTGAAASVAFTVDTIAPVVVIDSGPSGLTNQASGEFVFSSEAGASFACKLDLGDYADCDSRYPVGPLADGEHTFSVKATDEAGNTGAAATSTFTVDTQPPAVTIDSAPSGATNDTTPEFAFSSEPDATFECALGGAFAGCDSPYRVTTPLTDGAYSFQVKATDAAGNEGAVASTDFTVDTVGPEVTITVAPAALTNDSTPSFEFTSEDGASFECSLDGPFAGCGSSYQVLEALTDGEHTFQVRATDAAANTGAAASVTFTVDTIAPVVTIDSGPSGLTNQASGEFVFSSEADASFECKLDLGDYAACDSPYPVSALGDGEHSFSVQASDEAGNTGAPASRTFTVDTQAPETTITGGPAGPTNDPTPTFAFASEPGASFACRVDEGAFAGCGSEYTTAPLLDGPHTFQVRASDVAGNTGASASRTFTVDTQGPVVALSGPSGPTNDPRPSFDFTSEDGATFTCALGGAPGPCTSPYVVVEDLADGDYRFDVAATDEAGNTGATASLAFTVDTQGPVVALTGPSGPTNDNTPTFDFTSEDGASFECSLGGAFGVCESPYLVEPALADGKYTFQVRASDTLGNLGDASSLTFTVDTEAPAVTIDSGPEGPTNSASATFTFSSEPGASFSCALDGGAETACNGGSYDTGPRGDGEHTFQVAASDAAGNAGVPESRTWSVDTQGPVTVIDQAPADPTSDTSATFTFAAGEDVLRFECRLDAASPEAAYATCVSGDDHGPLALGDHLFEVRAVDFAGNVGAADSHAWTIEPPPDTTKPVTTIDFGPDSRTSDTSARFEFSADEQVARFECRLDSNEASAYAACSSGVEYGPLALGDHVFEVRAVDLAGNVGDAASYAWTIEPPPDTTDPETELTGGPTGPTNDPTPTFAFTSEAGATFACRVDAADFATCTSPHTTTVLPDGAHTFQVQAIDAAGNRDDTPAGRSFTVDTAAPQTTIDSGPEGTTTSTTASFEFSSEAGASFECSLDNASFGTCNSPREYTNLGVGPHKFEVRATDAAGNTDGSPASRTWTIEPADTTDPETTLTGGPTGPTNDATPTFTFSSEAGATFACRVDSASFATCASPHTTATLGEGAHTFYVQAIDAAGNRDDTPASRSFTVDTTAPTVTLAGPQSGTQSTNASFTFSANEGSFQCSLDTAGFADCTSPRNYSGLQPGPHDFRVRATDAAGNSATATWSWTIAQPDTTPPTITLTGPQSGTQSTTASFTFSANEQASFQCSLDGGAFGTCTSPHEYTGLQPGPHEFRVRATDTSQNSSIATWSWTIASPASCTAPATVTLSANADSWLLQTSTGSNYGSDSALKVDTKSSANARAVVRFGLPTVPAGCAIKQANLRLYASSYKDGRTLEAAPLAASWSESSITWQNQPATSGTTATTASGSGYRTWNVTSQVSGMVSSGVNNGFLIRDASENGPGLEQVFNSREKGTDNPPQLVVTIG